MENRLTRTAVRRALVAFAPAVLLVALVLMLSIGYRQTQLTRQHVGRSREAALAAERVFSSLKDAESGNRGFLLIGDEQYLGPYHAALTRLHTDTAGLRATFAADPVQLQRMDSLALLIDARLALLARGIELRRAGQLQAALDIVRGGAGMDYMQRIRAVMTTMIAREQQHAANSLALEERGARALIVFFGAGIALLLILGYIVNHLLLGFATARARAAEQIQQQHGQLQEQALELEVQRDHLQEQNIELELQQDQLEKQAVEMELQQEDLQLRATELEQLNARLEETITALDAARLEAEQANRAKSQFLAAMSHELRTPLNAIAGYVDLLEAGVYGQLSEVQLDAIARVRSNQQHLLAVISDILSYAGIAAGSLRVLPAQFALQPLIAEVEKMIHPVASEQGLTLLVHGPSASEPVVAHADSGRVRQILINLLANAVKFTPSGGSIAVACRQAGDVVEIDVQDNGRGIPADKLETIFQPFVQLDRRSHEQGGRGGLGLGLALSRELARGMGGDVTVRSTPGVGSVFTLRVPAAAPAEGMTTATVLAQID